MKLYFENHSPHRGSFSNLKTAETIDAAEGVVFSSPEAATEWCSANPNSVKTVVVGFETDPVVFAERNPKFLSYAQGWICVAHTSGNAEKLRSLGMEHVFHIPPLHLARAARPPQKPAPSKDAKYLIGFGSTDTDFHRSGADVFAAIVLGVCKRLPQKKIGVLATGPLFEYFRDAQLDVEVLSETDLYQKADLFVVAERWKGTDSSILEAIASNRKVISSNSGHGRDLLDPSSVFDNISSAIDLVVSDIESNALEQHVSSTRSRLEGMYGEKNVLQLWESLFLKIDTLRPVARFRAQDFQSPIAVPKRKALLARALQALRPFSPYRKNAITIWGEIVPGPYGGGSQFLRALSAELEGRGYVVQNNSWLPADGHILNSRFFDVSKAAAVIQSSNPKPRVLHRIDGPVSLYRESSREIDDLIFELNRQLCTTTVFQSVYSLHECLKMGYRAVNPTIIRNACDGNIFYPSNRKGLTPGQKVRLVTTSWSDNVKKGFNTLKFLDDTLDFNKYEFLFIGRAPYKFKNIIMKPPVDSQKLGEHLRESDIYIFPSLLDSASNALLEGITSGLPTVYMDSGGNREFTFFSGIFYREPSEIPQILDKIVRDYESYRMRVYFKTIQEIASAYLAALELSTNLLSSEAYAYPARTSRPS